jgi:GNAT superfamily N-acetyltransferase
VEAVTIRAASVSDVPAIYAMLRESAIEQNGLQHLCVDERSLCDDGFGETPRFWVLVAEEQGKRVGLALYFFTYSTWSSRIGLYLEDLYVSPVFRRRGVARALMQHLARVALENGCNGMIWLVLSDNPAVKLYEQVGAVAMAKWMPMRVLGESLRKLADARHA